MHIDYRSTLHALDKIVEEKGESYIYIPPKGAECVYIDQDGKPSCLVGHVFDRFGVNGEFREGEGYEESIMTAQQACEVLAFEGVYFTPKARYLLALVQDHQDHNIRWGRALRLAIVDVVASDREGWDK